MKSNRHILYGKGLVRKSSAFSDKAIVRGLGCATVFGGLAFSLVIGGFTSTNVNALTAQEDVNVYFSFNPTLGINLSSNIIMVDNLIPGNASKSQNITITANSNSAYGYKILATVGDGEKYTDTNLVNGEFTFTSLALNAGTALASMGDSTWGWSKNNVDAFYGLPYFTATPAEIASTNAAGQSTTTFAIGAKAAATQVAGDYTNVINFALVGNVVADTIQNVTTMQDFAVLTAEQKASVIASMEPRAIYTLQDTRDGKNYGVSKLPDGKVWMMDNLALDLTDSSVQGKLDSYNTNATDLSLQYLKGEKTRDPSEDATGKYATAGVSTTWTVDSFSAPLINTDYNDTVGTTDKQYGNGSHKYGTYYNYCAATAGSYCYGNGSDYGSSAMGNATEDVCPKGWRLPTNGSSSNNDYYTLCGVLLGSSCVLGSNGQPMVASGTNSLQYALSLPLAGKYNDGAATGQGTQGYFWPSTTNGIQGAYRLLANSSNIYLQNSGGRQNGFSVRCVLGS